MKQDFQEIMKEIKEETMDVTKTKGYILSIKKIIDKALENCKDEASKEEILQEFLEEYKEELSFRGNAIKINNKMLQYKAYKELLSNYKGNKNNFNSIVKEAKRRELARGKEELTINRDLKERMITALRNVLRTKHVTGEKDMITVIQQAKNQEGKALKERMIEIIQKVVTFLEEYGSLDKYIEESNDDLEKLELQNLKFTKRNPIPDEEYDKEGKTVENKEDIGVIDSFSTEYLEQLSPEDLAIMTTFWESKYMEERLEISKAMAVIDSLGLWKDGLDNSLDNKKISGVLKKDLALTYLYRTKAKITLRIKKQYLKLLKENGIDKKENIEEELEKMIPEMDNFEATANDILVLQCLIIDQLQSKDIKIKNWGIIEDRETDENTEKQCGVQIAIEHENFRGPLLMEISERMLNECLGTKKEELPKYKNSAFIDETYSNIMAKLYLPSNENFRKKVKEAYKENPQSGLLAVLSGRKPKAPEDSGR